MPVPHTSRGRGRPRRTGARPPQHTRTARPAQPRQSDLDRALAAAERAEFVPATSFAALGLPEVLIDALVRAGRAAPFPIQARTIPDALAGRDVLGRAQTGSGKTLAFGLPLLARLAGGERRAGRPRGLVLLPTRELAQQVHDALQPLGRPLGVTACAVYGGAPMGRQVTALRAGVDVVIATPGRLQDLIDRGECALDGVQVTVLDEADHMADLGFLPVVRRLLDRTPPGGQRLLFSATLDRGVDTLVRQYLTDPVLHAVADDRAAGAEVAHRVFAVSAAAKAEVTAEIAARPGRTLIFVRTKRGADRLATQLRRTGVAAGALHGNLAQPARTRALDAFARGVTPVLVATDVAARGIHVDDVDLVVHYDVPTDAKDYLHRSGRTARAGAAGTVLSLVGPDQLREAQRVREGAAVSAEALAVVPGHPAVREIATSGTPVVVQPQPQPHRTAASRPAGRRPARRAHRPSGAGGGRAAVSPSATRSRRSSEFGPWDD